MEQVTKTAMTAKDYKRAGKQEAVAYIKRKKVRRQGAEAKNQGMEIRPEKS